MLIFCDLFPHRIIYFLTNIKLKNTFKCFSFIYNFFFSVVETVSHLDHCKIQRIYWLVLEWFKVGQIKGRSGKSLVLASPSGGIPIISVYIAPYNLALWWSYMALTYISLSKYVFLISEPFADWLRLSVFSFSVSKGHDPVYLSIPNLNLDYRSVYGLAVLVLGTTLRPLTWDT